MIAVAFTGRSNSGKTTLIEKIANILIKNKYKVLIIKNDPKDKAVFDVSGKDSDKFFKTGSDVYVLSSIRTTSFKHSPTDTMNIIELEKNKYDYLLVEGLKYLQLPRIGIFRNEIDLDYLDFINCIAIDDSIDLKKYKISNEMKVLNLNDPIEIIDWINRNGINK